MALAHLSINDNSLASFGNQSVFNSHVYATYFGIWTICLLEFSLHWIWLIENLSVFNMFSLFQFFWKLVIRSRAALSNKNIMQATYVI